LFEQNRNFFARWQGLATVLGAVVGGDYPAAMNAPWVRIFVACLKFLFPLAIIAWLLGRIEAEQWAVLSEQSKNFPLLGAAMVVAFFALTLSMLRWGLLVRCNGIPLGYIEALRLGAIGFLLSFVSVGSVGGDLFKAVFLARRSPGKRIEALASVAVDRGVGLYGLLLVGVFVLFVAPPRDNEQIRTISWSAAAMAVAGTVVLATLILGGRGIDKMLRKLAERKWLGPVVHAIADPLRIFHTHPWQFFASVVISICVHILLSVSIYLIAIALFADAPSLGDHLIIVPIGMLASALPVTPAGIGVLEATIAWLYEIIPKSPTNASGTLVALVFEIVKILLALVGMLFYWSSRREVKATIDEAQAEEGPPTPVLQPTAAAE
jgi:uncharacterized protein (TIRG00374 family)